MEKHKDKITLTLSEDTNESNENQQLEPIGSADEQINGTSTQESERERNEEEIAALREGTSRESVDEVDDDNTSESSENDSIYTNSEHEDNIESNVNSPPQRRKTQNETQKNNPSLQRKIQNETPNNNTKSKICWRHEKGTCKYTNCKFDHPKKCRNITENGVCKYKNNCKFYHPKICYSSINSRKCMNPRCSFVHIPGTVRPNPENDIPRTTGNGSNKPKSENDIPRAMENGNKRNEFFLEEWEQMKRQIQLLTQNVNNVPWEMQSQGAHTYNMVRTPPITQQYQQQPWQNQTQHVSGDKQQRYPPEYLQQMPQFQRRY
jgi:hypothetical protein